MAVEVVDGAAQRVLEYVAMLQRQGYRPSESEVEAFGNSPKRREPTNLNEMFGRSVRPSPFFLSDGETYIDYFRRLGWIRIRESGVELTKLSLAMLRDLNSPSVSSQTQSFIEVVVKPDDKLSFTKLLHQFNNLGDALLVDPWLKLEQFMEVAEYTPVTRILTSARAFGSISQRKIYQRALSAVDGRIEVRYIDALHDRHYIPDVGNIWMLGVSLNGVAKNVSVLTQLGDESSASLRDAYEKFWNDATVLDPIQQDATGVATNSAVLSVLDD